MGAVDCTQRVLMVGLFVAVELVVANVVEPWLYGASMEISPLAVIVSALFWTWLWAAWAWCWRHR